MIHNLLPNRDRVYLTYDARLHPRLVAGREEASAGSRRAGSTSRAARRTRCSTSTAAAGATGASPTPTTRPDAYGGGVRAQPDARSSATACWCRRAGHLHPGGLYTDLKLTRDGRTVNLFRSRAQVLGARGRGVVGRGDDRDAPELARQGQARRRAQRVRDLRLQARVLVRVDGDHARWPSRPARAAASTRSRGKLERRGRITHGHLRENRNHGGEPGGLPDPRTLTAGRDAPTRSRSPTSSTARATCCAAAPPRGRRTVAPGQSLAFINRDAARTIFHTITACRAPCNRTTGIAYPLADGPVDFDSGELGFGPQGFTAAANRDTWSTPVDARPRHLHLLLPRAPVHARGVPGQRVSHRERRSGRPSAWPKPSPPPACGGSPRCARSRAACSPSIMDLDPAEFATPAGAGERRSPR